VYENRFPNGSKTILYKKTKLEKFAPHMQEDGLVTRITTYADYDWTVPEYVYEYYSNRVDCLLEVRRNLLENSVVEVFHQGRDDRLRGTVMVFCLQQNKIVMLKHIICKQIDVRGGRGSYCSCLSFCYRCTSIFTCVSKQSQLLFSRLPLFFFFWDYPLLQLYIN